MKKTGIDCDMCGRDPGPHPNNPNLWNGFRDGDTSQRVCNPCKKGFYLWKATTDKKGLYSETPIAITTELLNRKEG